MNCGAEFGQTNFDLSSEAQGISNFLQHTEKDMFTHSSQNYAPEKHTDRLDHANIILDSFHQQFATRVRQKLLRDNFRCGEVRTKVGVTISTDMLKMNFLFWGQNMPQ